jgi:hypothetical protein
MRQYSSFCRRFSHGGIQSEHDKTGNTKSAFDIVYSKVTTKNNIATFYMMVSTDTGDRKPTPSGQLAGSHVFSYVGPTSLDSVVVGFEENAGILALAVTAHPDFDNTPLYNENTDNKPW